ncbi:MAG: DciA family protein [Candidatus Omnitrophica bacterium]|nr:DciA family protein [Candidatus Omnitrophota bacterium]
MATHIKELLKNFLQEKKSEYVEAEKLHKVINANLDKALVKHVSLKKIQRDTLVFKTDSSGIVYEFNLKKGALLKAIQKEFSYIEEIKITIG